MKFPLDIICIYVYNYTHEETRTRKDAMPKLALTPRQEVIANAVCQGHTSREIAKTLGISHRTVETHRYNMYRILRISRLAQLFRYMASRKKK